MDVYYEIDSRKAKLSQYDHKDDIYTKKKLSQREHVFSDGSKVQRDLYSAFLASCVNIKTHQVDYQECFRHFENFQTKHDEFYQIR